MTDRKSKEPIEAFGPELMSALLAGGRGRVVIRFDQPEQVGWKFAHTFRRRIHTLRQRMREMRHPDYEVAMRAQVRIFWGEDALQYGAPETWKHDTNGSLGAVVVIMPRDSEFTPFLSSSGITPTGVAQQQPPEGSEAHRLSEAHRGAHTAKEDYDAFLDELEAQQETDQ